MSKDKKVTTVSRGGTQERFGFIKRHGQDLGLSYLCDWLNISRSGYYEWLKLSDHYVLLKMKSSQLK